MTRPAGVPDRVCVAGLGVSGEPAARALLALGVDVVAVDAGGSERARATAAALTAAGADARLGDDAVTALPAGTELVVTSPGWRPDHPLLAAAARAGVPVWGDVELAWRLRPADGAAPWLAVTGTNGKTTTTRMLAAILDAAGLRAAAAGNVGYSLVSAVTASPAYDVLAVELSSFQLHWSESVRPYAATVLNVAEDHLDWHGSMAAYAEAKGRVYAPDTVAVVNLDDAWSKRLAAGAGRRVGFRLGEPGDGELGVVADALVDRAFASAGAAGAVELARLRDVRLPGRHNVANALAAAALARAYGVAPAAVAAGLRAVTPEPHRNQLIATVGGVAYVDDSKATNPHAAGASLAAYDSVVWIAGGLLKDATVDDLVVAQRGRLRGVVLIGRERSRIADALSRHAPDVPVVDAMPSETVDMPDVMSAVVSGAAALAAPGDTVLLAPAAASMDMFLDYAARGDAFAAAVRALEARP